MRRSPTGFALSLDRLIHLPHNLTRVDEIEFFLSRVPLDDQERGLTELSRMLLGSELLEGVFNKFHGQMAARLLAAPARRRRHDRYLRTRDQAELDALLTGEYRPGRRFEQNWIEYPRDLADFAVGAGLLRKQRQEGIGMRYRATPDLFEVRAEDRALADVVMDFDTAVMRRGYKTGGMRRARRRPFFATLALLQELGRLGTEAVPGLLLAATVCCLQRDEQVMDAARYVRDTLDRSQGGWSPADLEEMRREVGRAWLVQRRILTQLGLIRVVSAAGQPSVSITPRGDTNVQRTNRRAIAADLSTLIAKEQSLAAREGYFDPESDVDARERVAASIVRRRGQPRFRTTLIEAYAGRCAITGCDALEALEAVHIVPYKGPQTNRVDNGLLLRSDIHTLFDLGLLTIDPENLTVVVAPVLAESTYRELSGRSVQLPGANDLRPSKLALRYHWSRSIKAWRR
jgi:hypothetical protein